jgi:hypothetical protein
MPDTGVSPYDLSSLDPGHSDAVPTAPAAPFIISLSSADDAVGSDCPVQRTIQRRLPPGG